MHTKIIVLTHGWVLAAKVDDFSEELGIHYEQAAVIRRWGTKDGIGELVDGPTPTTVSNRIRSTGNIPTKAIVFSFDAPGWDNYWTQEQEVR